MSQALVRYIVLESIALHSNTSLSEHYAGLIALASQPRNSLVDKFYEVLRSIRNLIKQHPSGLDLNAALSAAI
jgi:hypothetical protein